MGRGAYATPEPANQGRTPKGPAGAQALSVVLESHQGINCPQKCPAKAQICGWAFCSLDGRMDMGG